MAQAIFKDVTKGEVSQLKRTLATFPGATSCKDAQDRTPLHLAAVLGNAEIVRELLTHKAQHDDMDKDGNTPLHLATEQGFVEVVVELLSSHARKQVVKSKNKEGQTPLHMAAKAGHVEVAKKLIEVGGKADVKDKDRKSPLDLVPEDNIEMAQLLKEQCTGASSSWMAGSAGQARSAADGAGDASQQASHAAARAAALSAITRPAPKAAARPTSASAENVKPAARPASATTRPASATTRPASAITRPASATTRPVSATIRASFPGRPASTAAAAPIMVKGIRSPGAGVRVGTGRATARLQATAVSRQPARSAAPPQLDVQVQVLTSDLAKAMHTIKSLTSRVVELEGRLGITPPVEEEEEVTAPAAPAASTPSQKTRPYAAASKPGTSRPSTPAAKQSAPVDIADSVAAALQAASTAVTTPPKGPVSPGTAVTQALAASPQVPAAQAVVVV